MTRKRRPEHIVSVEREWPFGLDGTNADSDSLLFRPYRRVATKGAPTGTINHAVLQTDEPLPGKGRSRAELHPLLRTVARLFGSFCYTPGGMILFFPGFRSARFTPLDRDAAGAVQGQTAVIPDHFTLEGSFERWHMTSADGEHKRGFRTLPLEQGAVRWFGLSVSQSVPLEPIYRRCRWEFSCPDSDSKRRFQDIFASAEQAAPHVIEAPDARVDGGSWFWHFEVVVSRVENLDPAIRQVIVPRTPIGIVRSDLRRLLVRSHPVSLPGFSGTLIVMASRLSGDLADSIVLSHV